MFNGKAGHAQLQFYRLVPLLHMEAATVKLTYRLVSEQQVTPTSEKHMQNLTTPDNTLDQIWQQRDPHLRFP